MKNHASLLEIEAAQTERAAAETQFEESMKQEVTRRILAIARWLGGTRSNEDHYNATVEREWYPESGRWLLSRPQLQTWLDFRSIDKPLLWIRGMHGAGNLSFIPSRHTTSFLKASY